MQNWEYNNTDLNTFGGFVWNSRDDSTSIEFVFDVGKENDAGTATRYLQSIVLEKTINEPWCYVITSDFGAQQELAAGAQLPTGTTWFNTRRTNSMTSGMAGCDLNGLTILMERSFRQW